MKIHSQFATMLCAVLGLLASSRAATIAITSPADNKPDVTCTATVAVTVTLAPGESISTAPTLTVGADNVPATEYVMFGSNGSYTESLDTLQAPNGYYTMVAKVGITPASTGPFGPPPATTLSSVPVHMTTHNGWQVVVDTAKTYAKVLAPTEGRVAKLNDTLTVTTDHQVTWKRFETCGTYENIPYRFGQFLTWTNILNATDPRAQTRVVFDSLTDLPHDLLEHHVLNTLNYQWKLVGGNKGYYTAEGYCCFPGDKDHLDTARTNEVAHDAHNWEFTAQP